MIRFSLIIAFLLTLPGTDVFALTILNSKHDMSATSATTGPKAVSEGQACIFCHTTHKSNTQAPLWNKTETAQTFTFYASYRLNTYLGLAQPTMTDLEGTRTKLCLSCHDGVTAIGSVYNIGGGPGTISMSGTMSAQATVGTNLSNDHPVLYDIKPGAGPPSQPGTDPEIQLPPGGDPVEVYGASNRVECTSCHNPHDNQYGKFLVKSNANAALCLTCHQKSGFSASIHATSNVAYTPPGGSPTTIGQYACLNCHKAHGDAASEGVPYLMGDTEENMCYRCHGNPPLVGAKNIQSAYTRANTHPTETTTNVHLNPETDAANLGTSTRHAECWDCHNPHQVQSGTTADKTTASNLLTGVLLGQWGVEPVFGSTPMVPPSSYIKQTFTDTVSYKEYQLCLKCHSSYAYGANPPVGYSDPTIRLNPNNYSRHPVFAAGNNPYCTPTSTNGNVVTMEPPFNQNSNEHNTISCSNCHASSDPTDPEGPHGSNASRILRDSLIAVNHPVAGNWATPLCVKCHKATVYAASGSGSRYGEHNKGSSHHYGPSETFSNGYGGCLNCHGNPAANGGLDFHGENDWWAETIGRRGAPVTSAGPAYRFMNNTTNFTGWEPGHCLIDNGGCNSGHDKVY